MRTTRFSTLRLVILVAGVLACTPLASVTPTGTVLPTGTPVPTVAPSATALPSATATHTAAATPTQQASLTAAPTLAPTAAAAGAETQIGQFDAAGNLGQAVAISPDYQRLAGVVAVRQQIALGVNGPAGSGHDRNRGKSHLFSPGMPRPPLYPRNGRPTVIGAG